MADADPILIQAAQALEQLAQRSGNPLHQTQAIDLAQQIGAYIAADAVADPGAGLPDSVQRAAQSMLAALGVGDFGAVLNHAQALVGALPGKPLGKPTHPWER